MSMESDHAELMKLLACAICQIIVPDTQYIMCPNSHTICYHCQRKVKNICPQCRAQYQRPLVRNCIVEQMINAIVDRDLNCKNYFNNCTFTGKKVKRLTHQKDCPYMEKRTFFCPNVHCKERLTPDSVQEHLWKNHKFISKRIGDRGTTALRYYLSPSYLERDVSWIAYIILSEPYNFYCCLKYEKRALYCFVSIGASVKDAERYKVEIGVGPSNDVKLKWTSRLFSLAEDKECIWKSAHCLCINEQTVRKLWTPKTYDTVDTHQVLLQVTISPKA